MDSETEKQIRTVPMLMDEPPITLYPTLACMLGNVNHALILQQLRFLMGVAAKSKKYDSHFIDNKWWVYNTYQQWRDEHFPWLSTSAIRDTFKSLEDLGIVLSRQDIGNPFDKTKWYTIDFNNFYSVYIDFINEHTDSVASMTGESVSSTEQELSCHHNTETTTENTNKEKDSAIAKNAMPDTHDDTDDNSHEILEAAIIATLKSIADYGGRVTVNQRVYDECKRRKLIFEDRITKSGYDLLNSSHNVICDRCGVTGHVLMKFDGIYVCNDCYQSIERDSHITWNSSVHEDTLGEYIDGGQDDITTTANLTMQAVTAEIYKVTPHDATDWTRESILTIDGFTKSPITRKSDYEPDGLMVEACQSCERDIKSYHWNEQKLQAYCPKCFKTRESITTSKALDRSQTICNWCGKLALHTGSAVRLPNGLELCQPCWDSGIQYGSITIDDGSYQYPDYFDDIDDGSYQYPDYFDDDDTPTPTPTDWTRESITTSNILDRSHNIQEACPTYQKYHECAALKDDDTACLECEWQDEIPGLELSEQEAYQLAYAFVRGKVYPIDRNTNRPNLVAIDNMAKLKYLQKKYTFYVITDTGRDRCQKATETRDTVLFSAIKLQQDTIQSVAENQAEKAAKVKAPKKQAHPLYHDMCAEIIEAFKVDKDKMGKGDFSRIGKVANDLLDRQGKPFMVKYLHGWIVTKFKGITFGYEMLSKWYAQWRADNPQVPDDIEDKKQDSKADDIPPEAASDGKIYTLQDALDATQMLMNKMDMSQFKDENYADTD